MIEYLESKNHANSIINFYNYCQKVNQQDMTLVIYSDFDNKESQIYVNQKKKMCDRLGISFINRNVNTYEDNSALEKSLNEDAKDDSITGVIVQKPLPKKFSDDYITRMIPPNKDVDGIHPENLGKLFYGNDDVIAPATARAVMRIFNYNFVDVAGKNVVIIGRSNIVGKPLAQMLINKNATVTLAHSKTDKLYLKRLIEGADILVSATGRNMFRTSELEGAKDLIIIDVGIRRDQNSKKIHGDITIDGVSHEDKTIRITPVPGGVGPMTVAMLIENLFMLHDMNNF